MEIIGVIDLLIELLTRLKYHLEYITGKFMTLSAVIKLWPPVFPLTTERRRTCYEQQLCYTLSQSIQKTVENIQSQSVHLISLYARSGE